LDQAAPDGALFQRVVAGGYSPPDANTPPAPKHPLATKSGMRSYCLMPKRNHTELHCAKDGPWITLRGDHTSLSFNLRHLVRDIMPAQDASQRHVMAQWLRDREAEGKEVPIKPPPGKVGDPSCRTAKR
jgi:hypothetical protein